MPYYVMKEGSQGQGIRLSDVEVILNNRFEVDFKKRLLSLSAVTEIARKVKAGH